MASKALLASVVVILGLAMIVATSVLNSGYVLAKTKSESKDTGGGSSSSGDGSNSGSSDGGSGNGDNSNSNNNGKINNPLKPSSKDNKDVSDIPEENGAHCLTKDCPKPNDNNKPECMIESCNPNFKPQTPPPEQPPVISEPKQPVEPIIPPVTTIINQDVNINIKIILNQIIHSGSGGGGHGVSHIKHGLSSACFDAIKIAWLGKIHRGQNHEVDRFIDKCLSV